MVLPLIGLLGAGLAATGAMSAAKPYFDERAEDIAMRRRAQRAQGIHVDMLGRGEDPQPFPEDFHDPLAVGDEAVPGGGRGLLNEAVRPVDYNAQLIRSGLLAPQTLEDPYSIAEMEAGARLEEQRMADAAAMDREVYQTENQPVRPPDWGDYRGQLDGLDNQYLIGSQVLELAKWGQENIESGVNLTGDPTAHAVLGDLAKTLTDYSAIAAKNLTGGEPSDNLITRLSQLYDLPEKVTWTEGDVLDMMSNPRKWATAVQMIDAELGRVGERRQQIYDQGYVYSRGGEPSPDLPERSGRGVPRGYTPVVPQAIDKARERTKGAPAREPPTYVPTGN